MTHVEESLSEQAALKEHLQKATGGLKELKVQLENAQMVSLMNSMKRLRDIEARGNVKVDRQNGRIVPVRPLDFFPEAPPKEKGPFEVQFKDAAEVQKVVPDLLEVMSIFDAPLQINCVVKQGRGDANTWQQLAERRAEMVKESLVTSGRAQESISISGTIGPTSDIFGQLLDTEIFPPKPSPSKSTSKTDQARSKSPAPKKK